MDKREREAWRAWEADPTDENAQRWAQLAGRRVARKKNEVPLRTMDLTPELSEVLAKAADSFLDRKLKKTLAGDFAGLTECHFYLLKIPPKAMRLVKEWYDKVGMTLELGSEEVAETDYKAMADHDNHWKREAETAARERDRLEIKVQALNRALGSLERDREKLFQFDGLQASYNMLKAENDRLCTLIRQKQPGGK